MRDVEASRACNTHGFAPAATAAKLSTTKVLWVVNHVAKAQSASVGVSRVRASETSALRKIGWWS